MGTVRTFDDILEKMRKESKSTVELGTKFEILMKEMFENNPTYKKRFDKVWMWGEWARENRIKEKLGVKRDLGVDLVARERKEGDLCAIQCKCYDENTILDLGPINKFISAATAYGMKNYILVCTGPTNRNVEAKMRGVKAGILRKEALKDMLDWSKYPKIIPHKPKDLREYQQRAMKDVLIGFETNERGKLIMACGTGKTLVSLHVAEKTIGKGGLVLYLVPSISLILQSMREWSDNSNIPHYYMAVCSDTSVRNTEQGTLTELEAPASTDVKALRARLEKCDGSAMNVVFSTYHSIDIVSQAMTGKKFDIVFCDEAHRTAGVEESGSASYYTMVHRNQNIKAAKRLYMTATPRIYTANIKGKALQMEKEVISMDDDLYGPEFHNLSFYDAVHKYDALCDFKVRVAVMDGDTMDKIVQKAQAGDDNQVPLDEKTLMASVWHAIQYPGLGKEKDLLQRTIMFCDIINSSKIVAGEEINYKADIRDVPGLLEKTAGIDRQRSFGNLVSHIKDVTDDKSHNDVDVSHVDGGDNAQYRRNRLEWLRESTDEPNRCRILSNARCLSEGVDVPALDGVIFMNPRKSVVDVVQAVGRVMRKSPGKKYGYVILPVAIPAGMSVDEALSGNKHFKVVWQVLNALRSHDPRLASEINKLTLIKPSPNNEITNRIIIRHAYGHDLNAYKTLEKKLIEKVTTELVHKVGEADYYDKYGMKIGEAAQSVESQIQNHLDTSPQLRQHLEKFHEGLKQIINDQISKKEAVQIIGQHIVLSRIFDMMFSGEFTSNNPISVILEKMAGKFNLNKELRSLEPFYDEVKRELEGIKTREARQNFIKKIYGNFFASTAKKETEQHGIVYTPVEIIDFIINSVQHVLKKEFNMDFNSRIVKVLEPFAGTGSFLVRLLESGYITSNLYEKYKHDLYANELILLAYYIATVNIETTYSSLKNSGKYVPFDGISYTDTLQMHPLYREDSQYRHVGTKIIGEFKNAHNRIRHQKGSHLHIILGNPPYSKGQSVYGDNNQNIEYKEIDNRIKLTFMAKTKTHDKKSLYDSYVRSLRWASDRIGASGIIAFITNASFIRSETAAGIRASFAEEFTDIWCFDLRGNARTQGETRKQEGGGIFGLGSRAPVAITILVKNPNKKKCTIHYKDIGDYFTRDEKLKTVKDVQSIQGIKDWQIIKSDVHHDWIDQRNDKFSQYVSIGDKETKSGRNDNSIFKIYSLGIATHRDVWVYNSSIDVLSKNMRTQIDYCNKQDLKNPKLDKKKHDKKQIAWTGGLTKKLLKRKPEFIANKIRTTLYRPFFKQYHYFDDVFDDAIYQISKFFPEKYSKNLVICVPYKFTGNFSVFVTDITPDLHIIEANQCFPLYVYVNKDDKKENILNSTLTEYRKYYKDDTITKKKIFYYVYAMLHHSKYRKKFANNLIRELPHIPMAPDFWAFSNAGEKLVDLHLNFDICKRYPLGKPKTAITKFTKMSFTRKTITKDGKIKQVNDKTKIKINEDILFDKIPEIQYQINGRTPLEWLIDRYKITVDINSEIRNDPCVNVDPIPLIERAVHVGIESDKIIIELSKEEFEPKNWEPKKIGLDKFSTVGKFQSKL